MSFENQDGCRWGRNSNRLKHLDRATGEFIPKINEYSEKRIYKVTINAPGYKPWVKSGIRVVKGKDPEFVVVRFDR